MKLHPKNEVMLKIKLMPRLLLFACFGFLLLLSCGSNNDEAASAADSENTPASMVQSNVANSPQAKALRNLMKKSDCATCHQISTKSIGPSYTEVANQYEKNDKTIAQLADKIIKGGAGVWGEIPMTAHPDMKPAEAEILVREILSLKDIN